MMFTRFYFLMSSIYLSLEFYLVVLPICVGFMWVVVIKGIKNYKGSLGMHVELTRSFICFGEICIPNTCFSPFVGVWG